MTGKNSQCILCFSSIDWDFIWQGHQEIMSTLARQGHRVLFVENTGVRGPRLRDLARIRHRYTKWHRSTHGFWQAEENLHVYSPLILPFPYSRWARWINRVRMSSALKQWMLTMDFHAPICWTFLPTPLTLDLIHQITRKLLVYYCIDSFADSTPAAGRIVPSEEKLLREADLVFVTSGSLFQRASGFNRQVHLFPFGVSFEAFLKAAGDSTGMPEELGKIPSPRIGYVGGIHQWIDQDLLIETARRHPRYSFVLIGPLQINAERLKNEPNIFLLGKKPHESLPYYIKHFDVGIIPYRLTGYTNNVYPTKLNEYHALGVPVVSTPLPEVMAFNRRNPQMIQIGRTSEEFGRALEEALRSDPSAGKAARVHSAEANAWSRKIDEMQTLIQRTIAEKESSRPNHWAARLREAFGIRPRWMMRLALATVVGFLLIFETPLVWYIAEPLRVQQEIRPADVIVVFSGGVGESGQADESYQERVKQAIELYNQGLAPKILFISGFTRTFHEADLMVALAKNLGIPASDLSTEILVTNTYDYVLQVRETARRKGWHRLLLVTSPYHTRRADLTFRRNAPELTVFQAPVSESGYYARSEPVTLRKIRGVLHEFLGLFYYWIRDWI